jgi:CRISPR-associated protein Cst2
VTVLDGVRKAADEARRRIARRDKAFAVLAEGR